jgi:hypothetical protein
MAPGGGGSGARTSPATTTPFAIAAACIIAASAAIVAATYAIRVARDDDYEDPPPSFSSSPSDVARPSTATSPPPALASLGMTIPPPADRDNDDYDEDDKTGEEEKKKSNAAPSRDDDDDGRVGVGIVIRGDGLRHSSSSRDGGDAIGGGILSPGCISIVYSSTTGTCERYARGLHDALTRAMRDDRDRRRVGGGGGGRYREVRVLRVSEVDWFDELTNDYDDGPRDVGPPILLFVLPTWTDGTLPPDSSDLLPTLREILNDWRVPSEPLRTSDPTNRTLRVGAFGMGSSGYDTHTMGRPAKDVYGLFVGKLGARPIVSRISGRRKGGDGNGGGGGAGSQEG